MEGMIWFVTYVLVAGRSCDLRVLLQPLLYLLADWVFMFFVAMITLPFLFVFILCCTAENSAASTGM